MEEKKKRGRYEQLKKPSKKYLAQTQSFDFLNLPQQLKHEVISYMDEPSHENFRKTYTGAKNLQSKLKKRNCELFDDSNIMVTSASCIIPIINDDKSYKVKMQGEIKIDLKKKLQITNIIPLCFKSVIYFDFHVGYFEFDILSNDDLISGKPIRSLTLSGDVFKSKCDNDELKKALNKITELLNLRYNKNFNKEFLFELWKGLNIGNPERILMTIGNNLFSHTMHEIKFDFFILPKLSETESIDVKGPYNIDTYNSKSEFFEFLSDTTDSTGLKTCIFYRNRINAIQIPLITYLKYWIKSPTKITKFFKHLEIDIE